MILRRILTYLIIGFAVWGIVALGLLVYAPSAPAPAPGLSPTLVTPRQPKTLPPLPANWQWYRPLPNEPGDRPPALLFGLPYGSEVVGNETWVALNVAGYSFHGGRGNIFPMLRAGARCPDALQPTGETMMVAGQPATVYILKPRRPPPSLSSTGGLCFEFQYAGALWTLGIYGIKADEWEVAYTIAASIIPDPQ